MDHDLAFRLILLGAGLGAIPVTLYFLKKSGLIHQRSDWRQEGLLLFIWLRLAAGVRYLSVACFIIQPAWLAWSAISLPLWLRWLGVPLGAAGAALLTWSFHSLGRNLTASVVTRGDATLITTGPYRWMRHPFYTAFGLSFVADALMTANWFVALLGIVVFVLLIVRTRTEEAQLVARFGDAYLQYMERTGQFLPWPR
jgi:protein-S-isoprenylcysteine O-methyltransferase Ste14